MKVLLLALESASANKMDFNTLILHRAKASRSAVCGLRPDIDTQKPKINDLSDFLISN